MTTGGHDFGRRSLRHLGWALAIGLVVASAGCACEGDDDGARLAKRLDGPPVQFHVALRALLMGQATEAVLRDLSMAPNDRDAAERLAAAGYDGRAAAAKRLRDATDSDLAPALPALRAREGATAAREHALVLLAWLVTMGRDEVGAASPVPLYEASRLDPEGLRPPVRPFAHAMRAWAYGQAGLCDLAEEEGLLALQEPDPEVVAEGVRRLTERGASDPEAILADLGRVRRLLGDGARACCLLRDGGHQAAARRFEARLEDAAALGVDAPRLSLLRAWVALATGRQGEAQKHVETVRETELREADRPRYKMIRDTLANPGQRGADDALERLVDRRWLSQLTLQASVDALERDGLLDALATRPATREALAFVEGERAAVEAARERYPFFDRADAADRDLLGRLRRWLGGD